MRKFREYIFEGFENYLGSDRESKIKYKEQVWSVLQYSYADIGGIKGSGFESSDSMVDSIPFWKVYIKSGRVHAVALYKDKNGRKLVAIGALNTPEAKKGITEIVKNEIFRSFGETSGKALGFQLKTIPWTVLSAFLIKPDEVQRLLPRDEIIPLKDIPEKDWDDDAKFAVKKNRALIDYGYMREIGGELHFKIMSGTSGKTIR